MHEKEMPIKPPEDEEINPDCLFCRWLRDAPSVTGFNIGTNSGASAGQTVLQAHIHLIPRRDGDCVNPRGGVRGVIDGKRNY
jgi:diadenosine tetraphosphate (Ap4A) HIT family hydrolase